MRDLRAVDICVWKFGSECLVRVAGALVNQVWREESALHGQCHGMLMNVAGVRGLLFDFFAAGRVLQLVLCA